jgi:tRNA(Ile)-lysidine synthase
MVWHDRSGSQSRSVGSEEDVRSPIVFDQVRRTIDRYHLLERDDRLIVGVSGGIDSMVLLHLLNTYRREFNLSLIVAHVNHGLRPEESKEEANLVQKESERLGLHFEYGQFDVKRFQRVGRLSAQDAGRRIRFQFFKNLLLKYQAQKIALGHNADDQVETVLLRLIRGSGLQGLRGMLPIREGRVIRPLLEIWKEEIESFAREKGIPFLLDSSNLKGDYLRNRVRLSLIPLIEKEYQPTFKKIVMKTSAILREENDYLDRGAEESYRKIIHQENEILSFRFSEFQALQKAIQWRMIQKIWRRMNREEMITEEGEGLDVDSIYRQLHQSSPSFLFELPRGIYLEKQYDMVSLKKGRMKPLPPFEAELVLPGRTFIDEIGREMVAEETVRDEKFIVFKESPNTAFLDYEKLQFPLKVRNFRPGDRFQPLGVKGIQKLKKFFIDHKIPRFERPKIPLLISGEKIVWIIGYRIDERVKVTEKTQRVLRIEFL